jgi:hypothetical protein
LEVAVSEVFFVWLVTVTFAPLTAAPDGSVTVPKMLPYTACAIALGTQSVHSRLITAARAHADLFMNFLLDPILNCPGNAEGKLLLEAVAVIIQNN